MANGMCGVHRPKPDCQWVDYGDCALGSARGWRPQVPV